MSFAFFMGSASHVGVGVIESLNYVKSAVRRAEGRTKGVLGVTASFMVRHQQCYQHRAGRFIFYFVFS
jgi:hypothetical protein